MRAVKKNPVALPPVILTSEPHSFAYATFAVRHPRLLDDIIGWNDYPVEIVTRLHSLREEILHGVIGPLAEDASDRDFWNGSAREYLGRSWLDVPWYWAEAYFWRRILEAVFYFQPGALYCRDPYAGQKLGELSPAAAPRALVTFLRQVSHDPTRAFGAYLHACLWGNRTDLSYAQIRTHPQADVVLVKERANILVDDTARVWDAVYRKAGRAQIDFICDNTAPELLFDLALADFLLSSDLAERVVFHVKPQPFFVSDAMVADVHTAIDALAGSAERELRSLAARLRKALGEARFLLMDHSFWVTGSFFHAMPVDLNSLLMRSDLVISKGDANYRRLVGDCHWDAITPFETAAGYFPTNVVALRTLKAEVIVGLAPGEAERLQAEDPAWRVNGKRGLIQFLEE